MSNRSSSSNRSDGISWHGNELGARHSASVPRLNSGGSHDTSAEPQRRDNNQGAANSQASDGQQPRDSNTERDGPSDPWNDKRKLNQAVTDFLGSSQSSKRRKSDLPEEYVSLGFFFHLLSHLPS